MKWRYAPTGLSDLVVYFLRRIYGLLRDGGFTSDNYYKLNHRRKNPKRWS